MEIFQTTWNAMTTPNEIALTICFFLLSFVEAMVGMQLFTTILNINASKKSKIIYVAFISILGSCLRTFIPDPYGVLANILIILLSIKFILKVPLLKSLLAIFIFTALSSILELFIFKFYQQVFNLSQEQILEIPIYRILTALSIYFCVYIIYRIIKYFKFNIKLENMTNKSKSLFIVNTFLGILAIGTQFFLMAFYSDKMPIVITFISIISICTYFSISIYSLLSTNKLDTTTRDLEEAQLYNKTLSIYMIV